MVRRNATKGDFLMSDIKDTHVIGARVAPARQAETVEDRRRPGRINDVSPALIPLLRNPTAGSVAGDLVPIDRFQMAAAWAASGYPAAIWRSLSALEQSAVIYRELAELDAANAARKASD
jgi:hypothetical protein